MDVVTKFIVCQNLQILQVNWQYFQNESEKLQKETSPTPSHTSSRY